MATSLLASLPNEIRTEVIDRLPINSLGVLPAVCKLWRGLLVRYIAEHTTAGLKQKLVLSGGRPNLSALAPTHRALLAVGGYNSGWNDHANCEMAEDGPGCEKTAEVVCGLGPPYNVATPPWLVLPDTTTRRADLCLVSAGANAAGSIPGSSVVYAIGGRDGSVAHKSCERLRVPECQLRGEAWSSSALPEMREARYGHVALCMSNSGNPRGDGWLMAAGGVGSGDTSAASQSAEYLHIGAHGGGEGGGESGHSGAWLPLPEMRRSRKYACSTALHGKWYVVGGEGSRHSTPFMAEAFDVWAGVWILLPDHMARPRFQSAAVTHRGRVLAVGGGPAEYLDPRAGRWHLLPFAFEQSIGISAVVHDEQLIIIGGTNPDVAPLTHSSDGFTNEGPGISNRSVRIYDLRYAGYGLSSQDAHIWGVPEMEENLFPPVLKAPLKVARWCGGACVVNSVCC